jgi:hypothetical protein
MMVITKRFLSVSYFLFQIAVLFSGKLYAQDYIVKNGLKSKGSILEKGTGKENGRTITEKIGKEKVKYTPFQVDEYQFKRGSTYRAYNIPTSEGTQRYFLQQLVSGKLSLYSFIQDDDRVTFYITREGGNQVLQIPESESERSSFLTELTSDNPYSLKNIPFVGPTRNRLSRLIIDYNKRSKGYLPFSRWEATMGITQTNFKFRNEANSVSTNATQAGLFFGVLYDFPISVSDFSVHPGIIIDHYSTSSLFSVSSIEYNLVLSQTRLNVPLNARYTFYQYELCPFIEAGPLLSRSLVGKEELYEYETDGTETTIFLQRTEGIPDLQFGYSVHAGFIYNYQNRLSYSLKVGYQQLMPFQNSDLSEAISINVSQFSFSIGLVF